MTIHPRNEEQGYAVFVGLLLFKGGRTSAFRDDHGLGRVVSVGGRTNGSSLGPRSLVSVDVSLVIPDGNKRSQVLWRPRSCPLRCPSSQGQSGPNVMCVLHSSLD